MWHITVADKHDTIDKAGKGRMKLDYTHVDFKLAEDSIVANEAGPTFVDVALVDNEEEEADAWSESDVEDEWVVVWYDEGRKWTMHWKAANSEHVL